MGLSLGKTNYRQICQTLKLVYQYKNMTRSKISHTLDIDRAMVTHIYHYLLENGWIEEQPTNLKKIPLKLKEDRLFAAGLELQPEYQILTICNLGGKIVFSHEWNEEIKDISDFILTKVCTILETTDIKTAGIAVAVPGICDNEKSLILKSVPFDIENEIKIPEEICIKGESIPVFVENDVRCWSWGKVSFDKEYDNFISVIQHFIDDENDETKFARISGGSALFADGKPLTGAHGCAGELPNLFRLKEFRRSENFMPYEKRLGMRTNSKAAEQVLKNMAITISYISTVFDAKKIFLNEFATISNEHFKETIKSYLEQYEFYPDLQQVELVIEHSSKESTARGACGLVFEELFVRVCESETLESRLISKN